MSATNSLVAEVAATSRERALLLPGDRILVAVSAGADSTALAWILAHLGDHGLPLELVLGHVDHGWRGPQAAASDALAVRRLAEGLGVEAAFAPPPPTPVASEDDARRWRYHALRLLAEARGVRKIATGHHLRDQAETVLMRLERQSGRVGLRGIPHRRPLGPGGRIEVIRPLLGVDPVDLRRALTVARISWIEDPTNADTTRDRTRAREHLVRLDARGAAASRRLAAFAARMDARLARREARIKSSLASKARSLPWAGAVCVDRGVLGALSAPDLDLALRYLGRVTGADRDGPFFTRRHLRVLRSLLEDGGSLDLPRGRRLQVTGRDVWLHGGCGDGAAAAARLSREDIEADVFDLPLFLATAPPGRAAFDADRIAERALLRELRPDDAFVPWSRHALPPINALRFLQKQGAPAWLRKAQVVLDVGGEVAWLVGWRVDQRYAVTPATRRIALLDVGPGSTIEKGHPEGCPEIGS